MSEENLTESGNSGEEYTPPEQLSITDAMSGVFASPSETFETIADTPKKNYWLIPVLICAIFGIATSYLFMSDVELTSKVMDKQKKKMQEKFEEKIKEGKMTREESDKTMETMNTKGMFFKIVGFGGAVVGPFVILLMLGVIYMIVLKLMKSNFELINIFNVVALAMLIAAVGNLIAMVISIFKGNFATIGPSLFFNEETMNEKVYTLLSKIDLFTIWFYAIIAIGLSRIARVDSLKIGLFVFSIWVVYIIGTSFIF